MPRFSTRLFEVRLAPCEDLPGSWFRVESIKPSDGEWKPEWPLLHKGFFDSHLHVSWLGFKQDHGDLQGCRELEEFDRQVSEAKPGTGGVAQGYGWDESLLGVSREQLCSRFLQKSPDLRPAIFYRVCGHSALVNAAFAERFGVQAGLVTDQELQRLHRLMPQPNSDEVAQAWLRAQKLLLGLGVSAVGDMSLDAPTVEALRMLCREGQLHMDVQGVVDAGRVPMLEESGPLEVRGMGTVQPLGRPALLQLRHWKRFLDGSFGSRTAWLSDSYADCNSCGEALLPDDVLEQEARTALSRGFALSFHAIGDAAADQALRLGERLALQAGTAPPPHRLEHSQLLRPEQLEKLRAQGWALCVQPQHRVGDAHFVEKALGKRRLLEEAYRGNSLWKAGLSFALGSDAPIDNFTPEQVLKAACTHPNSDECLDYPTALWCYTTGARLALGLPPGEIGVSSRVWLSKL